MTNDMISAIDSEREIHVRIQQLYGRKKVTTISGIDEDVIDGVLKDLKKRLSCGGSLTKDRKIVQLQGDYSYNIADVIGSMLDGVRVVVHGKK